MEKYDLYKNPDTYFIPDVQLAKVEGNWRDRYVWFSWRGTEQALKMSRINDYDDLAWLIVDTNYTDDFTNWLDENLDEYDSLEAMFSLEDLIPDEYRYKFEVK